MFHESPNQWAAKDTTQYCQTDERGNKSPELEFHTKARGCQTNSQTKTFYFSIR